MEALFAKRSEIHFPTDLPHLSLSFLSTIAGGLIGDARQMNGNTNLVNTSVFKKYTI